MQPDITINQAFAALRNALSDLQSALQRHSILQMEQPPKESNPWRPCATIPYTVDYVDIEVRGPSASPYLKYFIRGGTIYAQEPLIQSPPFASFTNSNPDTHEWRYD